MSERVVTYRGQRMSVAEAVRQSGSALHLGTVASRLARGWPLERALHLPPETIRGVRMRMRPLHAAQKSDRGDLGGGSAG